MVSLDMDHWGAVAGLEAGLVVVPLGGTVLVIVPFGETSLGQATLEGEATSTGPVNSHHTY